MADCKQDSKETCSRPTAKFYQHNIMFFKISHNKIAITVCTGSATVQCTYLKGVCHKIFYLHFFHDSNTSRPLINRLKYFRILFGFRRDIRIFNHHPAESGSTVGFISRSQSPRCASHHRIMKTKNLK